MAEYNYAWDWYKYGVDKGDDTIVKFIMHWIAFNWLYSNPSEGREIDQIKAFCDKNQALLERYNPFSTDEINIFLTKPVARGDKRPGENEKNIFRSLTTGEGYERLEAMILTLYRVRCNLFHGSKSQRNERDKDLVRAASTILEGYLKALPVETFGNGDWREIPGKK